MGGGVTLVGDADECSVVIAVDARAADLPRPARVRPDRAKLVEERESAAECAEPVAGMLVEHFDIEFLAGLTVAQDQVIFHGPQDDEFTEAVVRAEPQHQQLSERRSRVRAGLAHHGRRGDLVGVQNLQLNAVGRVGLQLVTAHDIEQARLGQPEHAANRRFLRAGLFRMEDFVSGRRDANAVAFLAEERENGTGPRQLRGEQHFRDGGIPEQNDGPQPPTRIDRRMKTVGFDDDHGPAFGQQRLDQPHSVDSQPGDDDVIFRQEIDEEPVNGLPRQPDGECNQGRGEEEHSQPAGQFELPISDGWLKIELQNQQVDGFVNRVGTTVVLIAQIVFIRKADRTNRCRGDNQHEARDPAARQKESAETINDIEHDESPVCESAARPATGSVRG